MNSSWLKDKHALTIVACVVGLVLAYSVNGFHLAYDLAVWNSLGATSAAPARLLYFIADTEAVIRYTDKDTGQQMECSTAVAYVATASGETYRCCQTDANVSCTTGNFSADIPKADPTCNATLAATYGAPTSLPGTKDYQLYGSCSKSGTSQLTVARINADGQIEWRRVDSIMPSTINGALRFILGPALLVLIIRSLVVMFRKPDPKRQIPKWKS